MPDPVDLDRIFTRLPGFPECLPAWAVTTGIPGCIHRFHHTSPISPSGRYLAVTKLPREDKRCGFFRKYADIVMIDLATGQKRIVAKTFAWDTQLGAQVQWGRSDSELLYNSWNDFIPGKIACTVYDLFTKTSRQLKGSLYAANANSSLIASNCLLRIGRTQLGYGISIPKRKMPTNRGAPASDGLYLTSLDSGDSYMLKSWEEITSEHNLQNWAKESNGVYGFHLQWNPQGNDLLLVLRRLHRNGRYDSILFNINANNGRSSLLLSPGAWRGNHPCWMPEGRDILMNLDTGQGLRFQKISIKDASLSPISSFPANRGHPSIHCKGQFLITDDYARNYPDGKAPLIVLDLKSQEISVIAKIDALTDFPSSFLGIRNKKTNASPNRKEMRVDLHPAWHTDGNWLTLNAVVNGTRCVCLMNTEKLGVFFERVKNIKA